MVALRNTAEGGSNTTAVTAANSGGASGTAWNSVNLATFTFATAAAMHGALGYRQANPGTTTPYLRWDATATDLAAVRFYFRMSALPGVAVEVCSFRNGSSLVFSQFQVSSTNALQLSIGGPGVVFTSSAALLANTWYRFEAGFDRANRNYRVAYYLGDSTTAVQDTGVTNSGATTWTNQFAQARFGKTSTASVAATWDYDDIAVETGSASLIGPATSTVYNAGQFLPFF